MALCDKKDLALDICIAPPRHEPWGATFRHKNDLALDICIAPPRQEPWGAAYKDQCLHVVDHDGEAYLAGDVLETTW